MNDRPTYPQLLKLFYRNSFPDQLGAPASAVAQAIIYKSNELWFPAEFSMSNKELSQLSGEKLSNIGRTRQKVLDTCKVDGQPLFAYKNGKQRRAGMYIINFNLTSTQLQDDFNSASTQLQSTPEIDDDPNLTLPNETKQFNNKPSAPLPEKKSNRDMVLANGMTRGELLDLVEFKPAVINYHKEEHMDILAYLGEQPRERIEWAVEQTKAENGGNGIGANGALKWIYNGVDQYEYRHKLKAESAGFVGLPADEKAINSMRQLVEEFRTIGENGQSRTGSTRQATINRLSTYRKWYDTIDNLGDSVGMQLEEYEALMDGGAK